VKFALRRRIANLERTRRTARGGQRPLTVSSFMAQVEERIRITGESVEEAIPALLGRITEDEVRALLLEATGSGELSSTPSPIPSAIQLPD
jgi:hypothetical protein